MPLRTNTQTRTHACPCMGERDCCALRACVYWCEPILAIVRRLIGYMGFQSVAHSQAICVHFSALFLCTIHVRASATLVYANTKPSSRGKRTTHARRQRVVLRLQRFICFHRNVCDSVDDGALFTFFSWCQVKI